MRSSLLAHLACPSCREPLFCFSDGTAESRRNDIVYARLPSASGGGSEITSLLLRLGARQLESDSKAGFEVGSGLLICGCGRWYPIVRGIPELLPDYLRDDLRDPGILNGLTAHAPEELIQRLTGFRPGRDAGTDVGVAYKQAEISIRDKVDEPMFFVPGETSPFAPWAPHFSLYLIKLFGTAAPLLNLDGGDVVIDSGCGYAWTTEWLLRSGFEPIGVDICRTYLDVGVKRMGASLPHLVVADVENLPFANDTAKSVLAYESFHHIPDRSRALSEYERVLHEGGRVILAEPGAAHETAQVAVDVMKKYGILEKGMELADVNAYASGTTFSVEQLFFARLSAADMGGVISPAFATERSAVENNIFRLIKGQAGRISAPADVAVAAAPFMKRVTARIRSGAARVRQNLSALRAR